MKHNQKLSFLVSFYTEFLEKRQRKKNWFLVNSLCFCFAFYANLMSDGKKKKTYIFVYDSINIADKHMN